MVQSVALFNDDISGYDNVDSERPTTPDLVRKWYDSALYYLHRADFLRVPDIRTVQAISILTNCFNTVGDFNFYQTLVPLAVRTAQILKIDRESDLASKTFIEREVCRRVWWTLVICEWFVHLIKKKVKIIDIKVIDILQVICTISSAMHKRE